MTVPEKVAYIKGLAEGLGLDTESKEGKVISAIIDVLDDVARSIGDLEENALCIGDELDELSADLAEVEDIVYECDDDACDCCSCGDDDDDGEEEDFEFDDEDYMFSVVCPTCNEEITLDESVLDLGTIDCPNCGEKLEFEFDEDEEASEEE